MIFFLKIRSESYYYLYGYENETKPKVFLILIVNSCVDAEKQCNVLVSSYKIGSRINNGNSQEEVLIMVLL